MSNNHFVCSAILFDLDGVLVDSTKCTKDIWRTWAKQHNLDPSKVFEASHGRRTLEIIQLIAPHLDGKKEADLLEESAAFITRGIEAIEGVSALLNQLDSQSYAVVTSSTREMAITRLQHVGLPLPEVIIGSKEVEVGKPHPEGYLKGAEQLGLRAQDCLVIEDAPSGVEAAKRAQIPVIGVTRTFTAEELKASAHVSALKDIVLSVKPNLPAEGSQIRVILPTWHS